MKIEIKEIIDANTIRITTPNERWYRKLGEIKWRPSSTWICEFLPKGIGFYKWLAEKGWDEAIAIREAAGNRGSRVHHAIEELICGNIIGIEDVFPDSNNMQAGLDVEEWECVMSFHSWWMEAKPRLIAKEQIVFNDKEWYAGTLDLICEIGEKRWIVDFKTSQNIYLSHEVQISSYRHCDGIVVDKIGILQLGYRRNKKGWKFTEIQDNFNLFLAAKVLWAEENENKQPLQKDFPRKLSLNPVIKM